MADFLLVRIRPRSPSRGQLVRRYVYRGYRFEVERGWYRVEAGVAEHLRKAMTDPNNPDSKPVFDVCTEEEARRLSLGEYEAANPEKKISEALAGAQTVTAANLDAIEKAPAEEENASGASTPAAEPADAPAPGEEPKPAGRRRSPF